jgi:putative colanic acid biosynthesis acetyltransferase WcaF
VNKKEILINHNSLTGPSFNLKNRFLRFLWGIIYVFFFNLSPRPFHKWRIFLLRLFGAKIGRNCRIHRNVKIWAPWNISIGNFVTIADNVNLLSMDLIKIDNYSNISDGTFICCGTHNYKSKKFELITKPVLIDKNVWICAQSFIHPGVKISEKIVVGARSVVTKSLKMNNSMYSGNPCKIIKKNLKKN